jgi:copper chaperone CopZ
MAQNRADFTVRGLDAEADAERISEELETLDGVMGTSIDPDSGEAQIRYDVDILAEERILETVRDVGYEVDED